MSKNVTLKQDRILKYIRAYVHKNQTSPTLRDIGGHFDIAPGTVQDQIRSLEKKGYLKREEWRARGIQLPASPFQIPIVGRVHAGGLHTAFENVEGHISYHKKNDQQEIFALHVKGDSMIGVGIHEGDIAIIRKQQLAQDGEIVVAMVDDEATIKIFRHNGRDIHLEPANPKYRPIRSAHIKIIGKVVEVRRRYE